MYVVKQLCIELFGAVCIKRLECDYELIHFFRSKKSIYEIADSYEEGRVI